MRTLKEGGATDRERLAYAFRLCTARPPTPDEARRSAELLSKEDQRIADGWLSARDLAGLAADNAAAACRTSRRRSWRHGPRCRACCSTWTRRSPRNSHELPGSSLSEHASEADHAPLVLRAVRRRPGRGRAGDICSAESGYAG